MKRVLILSFVLMLSSWFGELVQAQTFYGFQTITQHTYFFSVVWDGQANLGFGYQYRNTIKGSYTDLQAEIRYPLETLFQQDSWDKFTAIAGIYGPNRLRRSWVGLGAHIRYQHQTDAGKNDVKLALTVIPSYTYAAPTSEKPYATVGARLTYVPTVYNSESKKWFSAHDVEVGGHTDVLIERNLGLALNILKPIGAAKKPLTTDFYFGPGF